MLNFCCLPHRKRRSPIDSTCFTGIATHRSPTELFYTFFNLAAWIISEYGQVTINALKEGEDSAAAIRNLLQILRQLNFAVPSTLSASQLQGGSGREICGILNGLVDWALQRSSHQFQAPQHPMDEDDRYAVATFQNSATAGVIAISMHASEQLVYAHGDTASRNTLPGGFRNMELMEVHGEADMLASIAAPHRKSNIQDADDELSQLAPGAEPSTHARRNEAAESDTGIIENKV